MQKTSQVSFDIHVPNQSGIQNTEGHPKPSAKIKSLVAANQPLEDTRNAYNCLLKNVNFSIKTAMNK